MILRKCLYAFIVLVFVLSSCGEVSPPVTTDIPMTTEAPETNPTVTTIATTEPPAPVVEIPHVATAAYYTKEAESIYEGVDIDYVHKISYPEIGSYSLGALTLNMTATQKGVFL